MFTGPLWPAAMSLLTEQFGVELRTTQLAVVFVLTKLAIAFEQATFSWILTRTMDYYLHAVAATLLLSGAVHHAMLGWALPKSGLVPLGPEDESDE